MNILLLLSKLKRSPKMAGIRKFTNLLYYDPNFVTINISKFDTIEIDGCKFQVTDQINMNQRIKGNPWFEGVRSTDIVVDIGANIGAITIPLAKVAKKVYAVEPLYYKELEENIKLNGLKNIEVLKCGIGEGQEVEIEFCDRKERVSLISFRVLKETIGEQINFLKMDGEGCEWEIEPSELKGIRELRMEFHIPRDKVREYRKKYKEYLNWMEAENYEIYNIAYQDSRLNPFFKEDPEVRATLKGQSAE